MERWLADEPVTAYPDPLLTRLARGARRHKTAVATLGLAAWGGLERSHASALAREQEQTEARRLEAVADAETARQNAETARQNAERVEDQGRLALKTLTEVMGDFRRELTNVPAVRPLRVRLMERAVERMDQVVSAAESANANRASIWALFEIGDIYRTAGNTETGRWMERAKEVYGRAHTVAKRLAEADPTNTQAQTDVVVSHCKLGNLAQRQNEFVDAGQSFAAAAKLLQTLLDAGKLHDQPQFKDLLTLSTDRQAFCTSAIEACKSLDDALA